MQFTSILDIDEDCQEVYKFWPEIYHDFANLYKQRKSEIEKYISAKNRPLLYQLAKKNGFASLWPITMVDNTESVSIF